MLDAFFKRQSRIRKILLGPLGFKMDDFASLLKERGYSRNVAQGILVTAGELNNYLYARNLSIEDISPELIDRFKDERMHLVEIQGIQNHIVHILNFLRNEQILPEPLWASPQSTSPSEIDMFLDKYASYQKSVRGCSQSYISDARRAVKEFLEWNFSSFSEQSLSRVNGEMIRAFLEKNKEIKRHKVGHIRVFCQYLHGQGYCQAIPSIIFPSQKRYRLKSPPKNISVDSVHKILETCNRDYPDGMRDYAAILALVTLGLRVQEVANLQLDDINWRTAKVKIRKTKVGRERVLSLPSVLGKAMEEYVLYGRPNSDSPYLFLRHIAPGGPFTPCALSSRVSRRAKMAGIQIPRGACNIFRHSLATAMVNEGVSLKIISDLLDHRSIDTTAIYTMVDFTTLKKVILPLPGGNK